MLTIEQAVVISFLETMLDYIESEFEAYLKSQITVESKTWLEGVYGLDNKLRDTVKNSLPFILNNTACSKFVKFQTLPDDGRVRYSKLFNQDGDTEGYGVWTLIGSRS